MHLKDLPDTNTTSDLKFPKGEICVKGNSVMLGYYKEPKMTKEKIDEEGWIHLEDVGVLLKNGAIVLYERMIDVFKLQNG